MEIILTLAYTILFLVIIRNHSFFKIEGVRNEALRVVFLLKIAFGLILFLIYTYFYTDRSTADIFKYFEDSKVMYNSFFSNPLDYLKMMLGIQNDTTYFTTTYYNQMNNWFRVYDSNIFSDSHLIIRFNALVMLFSFGYYNVHTVFICFLSFVGLVYLFKFLIIYAPRCKFGLFISVFLIPSVLFWGSGVLKEGLIFFGLGLLLYFSDDVFERPRFWSLLIILFSTLLLLYTKIYVFLLIMPLILIFKLNKQIQNPNIFRVYTAMSMVLFLIGYLTLKSLADINLFNAIAQKQNDFILLAQSENAGSFVNSKLLYPTLTSYLFELPNVITNTILRPCIGIDNSIMMLPSGFENLVFLTLIVFSIVFRAKMTRPQKLLFYFSLWFVVGVYLLTGLTTPILGAIVRYKTIALPFLGVLFSLSIDKKKVYLLSKNLALIMTFFERKILYKSFIH